MRIEVKVKYFVSIGSDIVFEQSRLKRPVIRSQRSLDNTRALSRLHAQVLKLNKTVKEASGERHLKLIQS